MLATFIFLCCAAVAKSVDSSSALLAETVAALAEAR
jgi:hypothetical protein